MSKHISEETKGPRKGHAAGDTSIEQQASQLASDIKYKARKKMKEKSGSNLSPGQVQALYRSLLSSSPAPGGVKAIVKKKLFGEQVNYKTIPVSEHLDSSRSSVFGKVFVEGGGQKVEVEEIEEKVDQKFIVRVTDRATGNTSYRKADRAKIAELRANKNIASVEITGRKKADDAYGEKQEKKYGSPKGKNTVGDKDGDGTVEPDRHEYAGVKDRAIKKAMAKEEVIYEKEEGRDRKIDVMKGKNDVKINPTIGESIRAELDALKAKKIHEQEEEEKVKGPSPEERQQLMNKDKMLKRKIMMQKQTMQLQKQGKLPLNYTESCDGPCEKCGKSPCECEKKEGEVKAMDSREVPTRINLAKNKLRAMGLKMSYDMEGEMVDEKVTNPYAVGMAAAMKQSGDKPPLKKSTITKAHKIARSIEKQSFEPEGEVVSEKDESIETKFKKAKTPHLLSKFRQEHPGSRQPKKAPGAKETESDRQRRLTNRQVSRAVKYGLTKKEKKESDARAKYDSARD